MQLEEIFKAIEDLKDKASVDAVYGEPQTVGAKTVIPVADIKYGFGLGYGEGPAKSAQEDETLSSTGSGGGVGGGVAARPVAVIEITDEKVSVKPVMDEGRIAMAGIFTGVWTVFWFAKTLKAIFGKK